jgi:hypothetical protein
MNLLGRWCAALAVAFALGLALTGKPAHAQPPPPVKMENPTEEDSGGGDPIVGYAGTTILACLALFIVCKSARR